MNNFLESSLTENEIGLLDFKLKKDGTLYEQDNGGFSMNIVVHLEMCQSKTVSITRPLYNYRKKLKYFISGLKL